MHDCIVFKEDIEKDIVYFKESRIWLKVTNKILQINFGNSGMKKLVDDRIEQFYAFKSKEVESYFIVVDQGNVEASPIPTREIIIQGAQATKKKTG